MDERPLLHAHRRERALKTVEHLVEQPRSEPDGELRAGRLDGFADGQAAGALVDLDDGAALLEAHDLAHEAGLSHQHALVQAQAPQVDADRGPGDTDDPAFHGLSLTW